MKKFLAGGALILMVLLNGSLTANAQRVVGGYKPAKTDDARVVAAAEFAVEKRVETNTEEEGLTLESIDKAETQVVAGTNFRLCLTVRLEDETQQVQAVVNQNPQQEYSLKSWTVADCAEKSAANSDSDETSSLVLKFVSPRLVKN